MSSDLAPAAEPKLTPTPEQQAILDAGARERDSLLIDARAGCAKTTTAKMLARVIPRVPSIALAFNVKIKKDLEAVLPPHFTVMTLNGLGHRAWGQAIGKRLNIEDKKLGKLVSQVCKENGFSPTEDQWASLRSHSSNVEGRIVDFTSRVDDDTDAVKPWTWGEIKELASFKPGAQIAIICRNNAPLLGMAFKLIRQGVGCYMLGRDIGKGLIALSKKIIPSDTTPKLECLEKVHQWAEHEISLLQAKDQEDKIDGVTDRAECLNAILENIEVKTAGDMRRQIERLFSRETGITLGTGHRVKGLEYDLTIYLDPWRVPSRWAKKAALAGNPVPLEQELNIDYVIKTRTKHTMVKANLEDFT